jgi:hypothetical protein
VDDLDPGSERVREPALRAAFRDRIAVGLEQVVRPSGVRIESIGARWRSRTSLRMPE